ncbi:MAG: SRPBCC family protein [Chloroflexales bacterium]|nr:SRPBCC family protein [Chloroflexales bacterium]
MSTYAVSASALIAAPPQRVYGVIADYHQGHPLIIPRPPFVALVVEQGGIGAGTVIRVQMHVLGQRQGFRSVVTEPEPGRVLVETNDNGSVTTFTVEPRAEGRHAYVTISTAMPRRAGLIGTLERWFVTRLLRPTYGRELGQLATVAGAAS